MPGSPGRAEAAQHLGKGGARTADHGCAHADGCAHNCADVVANVSIHSHALAAVRMGPQDQCSVGKGKVIGGKFDSSANAAGPAPWPGRARRR